jgi:hypothetical protein
MVYQVPQASYREARDAQQSMRFAPSVEARGGGNASMIRNCKPVDLVYRPKRGKPVSTTKEEV